MNQLYNHIFVLYFKMFRFGRARMPLSVVNVILMILLVHVVQQFIKG